MSASKELPPEDLQEWAALYRDARRPPSGLAARILAQSLDASEPELPTVAEPEQRWGFGLAMGALVGIAALLALTWSMDAIHASQASVASPVEAPLQADPADDPGGVATPRETPTKAVVPRTPPEPTPAAEMQPDAMPTAPKRQPATRSTPPQPSVAEAPAGSVDLESMRKLRAAEALLPRDPAAARKALEQHVRDYPRSPMMLEREALWIRAACKSGVTGGLQRRRDAFFQRADVSAYRDAIVRACD